MAVSTAQPFPPTPKAGVAPVPEGVTITAVALAAETGADLLRAERLLRVATQAVVDYAPDAPTDLLNEAVIRFAGYLSGSDYGGVRQETVGPQSVEYQMNHAAAFRNSGAAALLTRHKVRRAGSIG